MIRLDSIDDRLWRNFRLAVEAQAQLNDREYLDVLETMLSESRAEIVFGGLEFDSDLEALMFVLRYS